MTSFHESYYAHSCPIMPEEDVLHTDIKGRSCFTELRRWWNDLFLLSVTNERSRGFYNSSHAMRIERFKQFRRYRSRIHPMSKFINFWDSLILFIFVANKILCRFTSTIIFDQLSIYYYYLGSLFEVIIFIDLFVNLKTGYIDEQVKKVVLDTKMGLVNYCSKKLFIHFMSALPVHWLMFLRYGSNVGCGLCKCNKFMCALKILSAFSLYRVFEMSAHCTNKSSSPERSHAIKFCRIGIVGLVSMLEFYEIVDVVWTLSMIHSQNVESSSFIGMIILIRYGVYKDFANYMIVCFDISRIFKSLLLFSFGIKHSDYALDKLAALIAYIIANSFFVWSLLECYSMVSCQVYPIDKLLNSKRSVLNLIASRQLSDNLKMKVEEYFDFNITNLKILELANGLHKSLPEVLRNEATLSCNSKRIMKVPLFSDCPVLVMEQLALLLKREVYLTGDYLSEAWSDGRGLIIVDVGVLAIYTIYKKETGHLIDGDFFGEVSLFTDKEARMSYVVAVTACSVLILDKRDFRKFMRQHRKLFYDMKRTVELKYGVMDDEIESPPTLGSVRRNKFQDS